MPPLPKDLLLIPALFCDEELYSLVEPQLEKVVDVHVVAVPRDTMAESVTALLDKAPRTFVLGGASYGAALAIEVALAAPDRVKGLWLMGNDPAAGDPEQGGGLVQGIESNTDGVIDMLSGVVAAPHHTEAVATFKTMAKRVGSDVAAKQARSLATRRSVEELAETLKIPVLAIWGEGDQLVPVEKGRAHVKRISNAEWHALPDCGHLPVLEKPAEVAAIFTAWHTAQSTS